MPAAAVVVAQGVLARVLAAQAMWRQVAWLASPARVMWALQRPRQWVLAPVAVRPVVRPVVRVAWAQAPPPPWAAVARAQVAWAAARPFWAEAAV
jgi:hypothetical protein